MRTLPVNDVLFSELLRLEKLKKNADFVFCNLRTGKPFGDVKKGFKSACKRAELAEFRFHDLRHTFASRLISRGVDVITLKELLGHSSVTVTQRYTHSCSDLKKAAVRVLTRNEEKKDEKKDYLLHHSDMTKAREGLTDRRSLFSVN